MQSLQRIFRLLLFERPLEPAAEVLHILAGVLLAPSQRVADEFKCCLTLVEDAETFQGLYSVVG
jgi:hypothetical protein